MAFRKIPINVPFWANAEDESRANVAEERRDVMKDPTGSTIRRPALVPFAQELPEPADGMFYWESADLVYIVSAGNLYSFSEAGVLTLIESGLFTDQTHVTWAESADLTLITAGAVRKLFASNGGVPVEYDGTTAQKLTDTDAPQQSTHLVMFDTYLLSNDKSQAKFDESVVHSEEANPVSFKGAFFSAENKADPLNALLSEWDEVALFGSRSIENFYNDGVEPFVPIPGGTVADGTRSPWTIKIVDNAYFFLNTGRRLVRLDGRQPTVLSQAIDNILSESPDFENAEGEVFTLQGKTLYLLTINDRTFVYDYALQEWVGEWGSWDTTTATYRKFKARNFLDVKPWGVTLCTDKDTGAIYKLDFDEDRDAGDVEVRSSVITGNIDHGTGREKRSNELRLRLKRGQKPKVSDTDEPPKLLVRWRDNGSKVWSNWRDVFLGFEGDAEFYYSLYMLGSYRARQYNFVCTDDVAFSIVDVEEDVELLR